jgi:hypothetical protein
MLTPDISVSWSFQPWLPNTVSWDAGLWTQGGAPYLYFLFTSLLVYSIENLWCNGLALKYTKRGPRTNPAVLGISLHCPRPSRDLPHSCCPLCREGLHVCSASQSIWYSSELTMYVCGPWTSLSCFAFVWRVVSHCLIVSLAPGPG